MPATTQTLCYNCFQQIADPTQPCPRCGFDLAENRARFPVALPAGTVLNGRYIVGRVLGQGGFGITYVAFDTQLQAKVAVKEYMPNDISTRIGATVSVAMETRAEDFTYGAERFREEARTLAKFIGHPNIAGVSSYFDENGTSYFVMDYIEGVSFKNYIANNGGKVSVDEALNVMIPVLRALTAVHAEGFIHRDVTPDNIYISKDGNVKLLDFGSARYSIGDKSKSLDVILKVGYAPKEQYIRRGRQGPYTDVYSCAACFYAALTGFLPPESLERLDHDELVPVSQAVPDIPAWLDRAILKGLAVQPEDRFQSAAEFLDAIENQLVVEVPGGAAEPVQPEKKKPKTALIAGIAAALAVVLGIGVFLGSRGGGAPAADPEDTPAEAGDAAEAEGAGGGAPSLKQAEVPSITIQGQEYSTDLRTLNLGNMGLGDGDIRDLRYMINLIELDLSGNDLTDLTPLAELTDLEYLNVSENPALSDFSPLAGLTSLKNLGYYGTDLSDYGFLAGLTGLENLQLEGIQKDTDLSFLSGMTNLKQITMEISPEADSVDISPLAGLTELTDLHIYRNQWGPSAVKDLTPLSGLTQLQTLHILPVETENLDAVAGLTELRQLSLQSNNGSGTFPLTDISGLANLKKLNVLQLNVGEVTDLSPLSKLTGLTKLSLCGRFAARDYTALRNLTNLQSLDFSTENESTPPESFAGLEDLTNLRELRINGHCAASLRDTSPLSGLTKLMTLYLPFTFDEGFALDLGGLAGLTNLRELAFAGKAVSLEPLRTMTGLRSVTLQNIADYYHPLTSLDVFSNMKELDSLTIGYVVKSADTSPVSQVANLNISYRS